MKHVNLADVKARLSEIVDQVEAGQTVVITRRGKPAVQITPLVPAKQPVDIAMLEELTKIIPMQTESAGDFVRRMRDDARY